MDAYVKVSSKYQIVIPKEVRKALAISSGDRLLLRVENGKISIYSLPENMAEFSLGLHKDIWKDVNAVEYVDNERESWA